MAGAITSSQPTGLVVPIPTRPLTSSFRRIDPSGCVAPEEPRRVSASLVPVPPFPTCPPLRPERSIYCARGSALYATPLIWLTVGFGYVPERSPPAGPE